MSASDALRALTLAIAGPGAVAVEDLSDGRDDQHPPG